MRIFQIAVLFFACFICINKGKSQNIQKGYLEQGFEYYFVTQNFDQALQVLETLHKTYDLKSVKLDYAIKIALKYKRDDLIIPLLLELYGDFNEDALTLGAAVGTWMGDSTFNFTGYFGKKWPIVAKKLELQRQRFEDNLKSEYYRILQNFLDVDQFIRMNGVSSGTFNEVDSINLDNFTSWLLEYPRNEHIKSRLNNQMIQVLLRHLGPQRFNTLSDQKVFAALLEREIISAEDYGLMFDYLQANKRLYFVEIDAFIEKSWDKSGIKSKEDLINTDQRRMEIGLLPLEYSGFCIQRKIEVPADLKHAPSIDSYIFKRK